MRILYVSGGSAGHLAPLVAVERAMKSIDPSSESFFICSDRPEDATYLKSEGMTFTTVPRLQKSLSVISDAFANYKKSKQALKEFKPDAVFSKGGAVSLPACFAAKRMKIPVVLHESDAVMGKANAVAMRWADNVCIGLAIEGEKKLSLLKERGPKRIFTGNPIRPEITKGSKEKGLSITGLSGKKPILLVMGGSQGAQALNEAVTNNITALLKLCDIVHLTGKGKAGAKSQSGYWSKEFAHEELAHLYAIADLALSRSGAGSMSELAANKIPAILVPIAGLANDHQVLNAQVGDATGGCFVLRQDMMNAELVDTVARLLEDSDGLQKMSHNIRALYRQDAARRIAEILLECIARRAERH